MLSFSDIARANSTSNENQNNVHKRDIEYDDQKKNLTNKDSEKNVIKRNDEELTPAQKSGIKLKNIRLKRKLSIQEAASLCGMPIGHYRRMENGKINVNNITLVKAYALTKGLRCTLDDLISVPIPSTQKIKKKMK